ncbi:MAG: hypothetical protein KGP10_01555 [Actinomycetales bacterium]|nr:hypothetical protein [Actinomycetales bacterium]
MTAESPDTLLYLGPPGTFTHAAVDLMTVPWTGPLRPEREVADIVFAVESGQAAAGMVPLESSVEGDVAGTLDELIFRSAQCFINEEVVVPVSFVLAVPHAAANAPVTRILTHSHAAAQCKEFLRASGASVDFTASTADACRLVAERGEVGLAALASSKGAEAFGLRVKQTRLEDFSGAKTRMALISRRLSAPTGHDKTTVVVTPVADRNGLLAELLACFASRDIGLNAISSRPLKTRLGEYCFLISARGHIADPTLQSALIDVGGIGAAVKILGCYPENPAISAARVGESTPPGSVTADVLTDWVARLVAEATTVVR